MGGKSGPDVPKSWEYMMMARQQADEQKELLREQTRANRPAQYTPWGTTIWEEGGPGDWTQTVTLPEDVQAALEAQQGMGLERSELGRELVGPLGETLRGPMGWDPLSANEVSNAEAARDAAEEAIYGRATSRLDPYWEQAQQQRETQLWNQGLRPGDEAYDDAMRNLGRARTDAYQTAMNEAIMGGGREAERSFGMDMARRQQAIAEDLRQRTQPLNELNTLMSGQQVGAPQFPTFGRAGMAPAADMMGALQAGYQSELDAYNAGQMRDQGLWSGVSGLASTFAPMIPWGNIGKSALNLFGF